MTHIPQMISIIQAAEGLRFDIMCFYRLFAALETLLRFKDLLQCFLCSRSRPDKCPIFLPACMCFS